jgi:putative transposase
MWKSHIHELDVGFVPDFTRFDAILGLRETRVLSHAGIRYEGLFYNSEEMEAIRKRDGAEIEVDIRVDRDDLGSIIVLAPRTKEPIRVKCLTPDYAGGLSLWQHKVCKAYAAKNRNESIDPETVNAWKIAHAAICRVSVRLMEEKAQKPRNPLSGAVARWTDNLEYHLGLTPSRGAIPDATEWRDSPASEPKAEPAPIVLQDAQPPTPGNPPAIDAVESPDVQAVALERAAPSVARPKANPRQRSREAKATSSSQPVEPQSVESERPGAEARGAPRRPRKFNAILT